MYIIKKLLSCIIIPMIIFMAVPFTQVNAESTNVLDTDVKTPSRDCIMLGIKGKYITNIDKALARINKIRYEACKEGVINPETNKRLTLKDYVPIKWSSDLEYIARIRAAEASVTMNHIRTNGNGCFDIQSPNGVQSYGEVLAWNWTDDMLMGIEQWYSEKKDWVNKNRYAVTGHYTIMINPNNTYVGLGTFCSDSGMYHNTTAGEFLSSSANLDKTHGKAIKDCIQKLEVSKSALDGKLSIKGNTQLKPGESSTLNLRTKVKYDDGGGKDLFVMDSSWKSSDKSILSVESSGNGLCRIKRIKCGKAIITASANGKNYTKTVDHKYKNTTVKSTYFAKGYTARKCSVCGHITDKKYTPMLVMSAPKANAASKSIQLSWNKVSGAKGYEVYQYKNDKWTKIKTTTSTSYTVKNLLSGTSQKFAIKPYSVSGGKTVYGSLSKQLYTSTNPVTVNFSLTSGTGKATVKWNKVTGASGYRIYYKTSKNGSWKTLKTVNNKTTSYTKTGLRKNKVYYFTVKAYRTVDGKTYNGGYVTKNIKIR